ncbi:hypothetical protein BD413DRAFT_498896 [Trametes elegans]|nr:hypothetical protein BD413DRAFT_498896 [Trametes elegans]
MTVGVILPPVANPPSDEYIVNFVVPMSNGWSGISMDGKMSNSLLFTMWPNDKQIVLGTRWADAHVLPSPYPGPKITLLPSSQVNSTHINAVFRCQVNTFYTVSRTALTLVQNCTVWEGGSLASGNLTGTADLVYVGSTMSGPENPSDVNSSFHIHDIFSSVTVDLSQAHSDSYSQYVSGGSASSTSTRPSSCFATHSSTTCSAPSGSQSSS